MKKNQPFPDKQSRDLFPKPFTKHYTERFPWKERDSKEVTWLIIAAVMAGFGSCVTIIYFLAWIANHLPKNWDL